MSKRRKQNDNIKENKLDFGKEIQKSLSKKMNTSLIQTDY